MFNSEQFEYIESSTQAVDNENTPFTPTAISGKKRENLGAFALFVSADKTKAKSIDGKVLKATFKKLTDEKAEIVLSNDYKSGFGYIYIIYDTFKQN